MSKLSLTVVVENTTHGPELLGEHGLAFWIEHRGRRIFFDTGQGLTLASNAYKLGVRLREIDAVVLSHGHYDHSGGAANALHAERPVRVYAHPAAFAPRFLRKNDGAAREIGMPCLAERAIRECRGGVSYVERPTAVVDGLTATGPIPRETTFEDTGGPFFLDPDCRRPDPLDDDQALFFDTAEGIVVLLGCAHAGVVNTLRYVRDLTGRRPIRAVLGGMHLAGASAERIEKTIEEFRGMEVQWLAPAHCTGMAATVALWNAFPGKCSVCHVGTRFQFETTGA